VNSYELSVSEASQPLKVTVVWTDPPGAVNAANVLVRRRIVHLDRCPCFDHRRLQTQRFVTRQVNDLDLTLEDPSGNNCASDAPQPGRQRRHERRRADAGGRQPQPGLLPPAAPHTHSQAFHSSGVLTTDIERSP
jgi:hypothetical protein